MRTLLLSICLLTNNLIAQDQLFHFAFGDSCLLAEDENQLKTFAINLRRSKFKGDIKLVGHTDSKGNRSYNDQLALSRARQVRSILWEQGVKNRVLISSRGESQLKEREVSRRSRASNRRVELELIPMKNSRDFGEAKVQIFEISSDQSSTILGQEGTKLIIPAHAFKGCSIGDKIEISLREYLTRESALWANLSTMTPEGELIESRGMIYLEAKIGNKHLQLARGKEIEIYFKDRKAGDGTQIFYGQQFDPTVTWVPGPKAQPCSWTIVNNGEKRNGVRQHHRRICETSEGVMVEDEYFTSDGTIMAYRRRDTTGDMSSPLLTTRLGWINCDRWTKSDIVKTNFSVPISEEEAIVVYLIFEDIQSILPFATRENDHFIFKNIPLGSKVSVVAIKPDSDPEACYFARAEAVVGQDFQGNFKFEKRIKSEISL